MRTKPNKAHQDHLLAFRIPKTVSYGISNHPKISSSFLGWEQCTLMLWAYIPQKGQDLRKGDNYRYLLSHRANEAPNNTEDRNVFALRYFPSKENQWGVWISNNRGERFDLNVRDVLEGGWHHFLIAWDHSKPKLVFQIDLGEGGEKDSNLYSSCWPEPEEEGVVVGSWVDYPSPPFEDSYCETCIYLVQIFPAFLSHDSPTVTAHWKMRSRAKWLCRLGESWKWISRLVTPLNSPNTCLAQIAIAVVGALVAAYLLGFLGFNNNQTGSLPTQTLSLLQFPTETTESSLSTDTHTRNTPAPTPSVRLDQLSPQPLTPSITPEQTESSASPTSAILSVDALQSDEFRPLERGDEIVAICLNRAVSDLSIVGISFPDINEFYSLGTLVFSEAGQASQCGCIRQKGTRGGFLVPGVCNEKNTIYSDVEGADWRNSTIKIMIEGEEVLTCPPQEDSLSDNTYSCSWDPLEEAR